MAVMCSRWLRPIHCGLLQMRSVSGVIHSVVTTPVTSDEPLNPPRRHLPDLAIALTQVY